MNDSTTDTKANGAPLEPSPRRQRMVGAMIEIEDARNMLDAASLELTHALIVVTQPDSKEADGYDAPAHIATTLNAIGLVRHDLQGVARHVSGLLTHQFRVDREAQEGAAGKGVASPGLKVGEDESNGVIRELEAATLLVQRLIGKASNDADVEPEDLEEIAEHLREVLALEGHLREAVGFGDEGGAS